MEVRSDLSKLLTVDLRAQKLKLQEAQSATQVTSRKDDLVNGGLPIINAVDADLSDWLDDCADTDTVQKVSYCVQLSWISIYTGEDYW